jgi:hypothetical protein
MAAFRQKNVYFRLMLCADSMGLGLSEQMSWLDPTYDWFGGSLAAGLAEQFEHVCWQGIRFYGLLFPQFLAGCSWGLVHE